MKSIKEYIGTDTILEFRANRSVDAGYTAGLNLHSCKTIDELKDRLVESTNFMEGQKYVRPGKTYGSDSDYIRYIHNHCDGETSSMILEYGDMYRRPEKHYDVFVVKPKCNRGYVISLNGIEQDGKINWKRKNGWTISVHSLDSLRVLKTCDTMFSTVYERMNILDEI